MSARQSLMNKANAVKERISDLSDRASKIHTLSYLAPTSLPLDSVSNVDVLKSTENRIVESGIDITAKLLLRLERLNDLSTEVWKRTTNLADKKVVEGVMLIIANSIEDLKSTFETRLKWVETTVANKIKDYADSSLVSKVILPSRNNDLDSVASILRGAVSSLEIRVKDMLKQNGLDLDILNNRVEEVRGFTGNFDGVYPRLESNLSKPLSNLEERITGLGGDDVLSRVESEESLADLDRRLTFMGF